MSFRTRKPHESDLFEAVTLSEFEDTAFEDATETAEEMVRGFGPVTGHGESVPYPHPIRRGQFGEVLGS
jgi:hypothetical protein